MTSNGRNNKNNINNNNTIDGTWASHFLATDGRATVGQHRQCSCTSVDIRRIKFWSRRHSKLKVVSAQAKAVTWIFRSCQIGWLPERNAVLQWRCAQLGFHLKTPTVVPVLVAFRRSNAQHVNNFYWSWMYLWILGMISSRECNLLGPRRISTTWTNVVWTAWRAHYSARRSDVRRLLHSVVQPTCN